MFKILVSFFILVIPLHAQDLKGHGGPIRALAVNGERLISGGFDQSIIIWNLKTNTALKVLRAHEGSVNALTFIDDKTFISGGEDGRIMVWDGVKDAPLKQIKAHDAPLSSFIIHENTVFSVGWDGALATTSLVTFESQKQVISDSPLNAITLFQNQIVTGAGDGVLKTFDMSGKISESRKIGDPINSLKATKNALILGLANGDVRIIEGGKTSNLPAQATPIIALSVSKDETTLAAAGIGGSVTLFNLTTKAKIYALEGPGLPVWSALISGDTLYTGGNDRLIRRWNIKTGEHQGAVMSAVNEPLTPVDNTHGARVFRACAFCHALTEGDDNRAGPTLFNVLNRKIGSIKSYQYSESLTNKPIIWTAENISKLFEIGPNAMLPGTKMPEQTINNSEDRASLIEFLKAFSQK